MDDYLAIMQSHPSIEKLRDNPSLQNEIFTNIIQIHESNWLVSADELGLDSHDYPADQSLLFQAELIMLKYDNGKPVAFNIYVILFAVGLGPNKMPIAPIKTTANAESYVDLQSCQFYEKFFVRTPQHILVKDLPLLHHANTIPSCLPPTSTSVWCETCHGSFTADNLDRLIPESIRFSDIPAEALLYVTDGELPIDSNDVDTLRYAKGLMKRDIDNLLMLDTRIAQIEAKIKEIKREMIVAEKLVERLGEKVKTEEDAEADTTRTKNTRARMQSVIQVHNRHLAVLATEFDELFEKKSKANRIMLEEQYALFEDQIDNLNLNR